MRFVLAAFYFAAGIVHLAAPNGFLPIMPDFVPWPRQTVLATGLCEIAGAIGLLTARWRYAAGIALAIYAVAVFPANIKHAVYMIPAGGLPESWWYHGPRLLLQPVIVWWALYASVVVDWPFASVRRRE
jgi:uncharacterized membrane protein